MFKVNDYSSDCETLTIEFSKHWHQIPIVVDGKNTGQTDGRYDTCCHITCGNMNSPSYHGKALLNPNDQLDRVIGKKIALTKAMIDKYKEVKLPNGTVVKEPIYWIKFCSKQLRTKIWKAFWKWVASWSPGEIICCATLEDYEKAKKEIQEKTS